MRGQPFVLRFRRGDRATRAQQIPVSHHLRLDLQPQRAADRIERGFGRLEAFEICAERKPMGTLRFAGAQRGEAYS